MAISYATEYYVPGWAQSLQVSVERNTSGAEHTFLLRENASWIIAAATLLDDRTLVERNASLRISAKNRIVSEERMEDFPRAIWVFGDETSNGPLTLNLSSSVNVPANFNLTAFFGLRFPTFTKCSVCKGSIIAVVVGIVAFFALHSTLSAALVAKLAALTGLQADLLETFLTKVLKMGMDADEIIERLCKLVGAC